MIVRFECTCSACASCSTSQHAEQALSRIDSFHGCRHVQVKLPASLSTAMEIAQGFQAPYSSSSKDGWGVGIGWDVETWTALKANSTLIWRAGNTYGCSAFIAMNSHLQKAFVLLANQGRGNKWSPESIGASSCGR